MTHSISRRFSELDILTAAGRAVFRRTVPRDEARFGAMDGSIYGSLVVGLVIATMFELVVVHLLISTFLESYQTLAHIGVLALHVYAIAWLIGDWQLMRESGHRVGPEVVELELGARWSGSVPLERIDELLVGEVDEVDVLAGEKAPAGTVAVTPWDTPNVTFRLRGDVELQTYFGIRRSADTVQVRVDEPRAFARAVESLRTQTDS